VDRVSSVSTKPSTKSLYGGEPLPSHPDDSRLKLPGELEAQIELLGGELDLSIRKWQHNSLFRVEAGARADLPVRANEGEKVEVPKTVVEGQRSQRQS
jgi:hypothetical protein